LSSDDLITHLRINLKTVSVNLDPGVAQSQSSHPRSSDDDREQRQLEKISGRSANIETFLSGSFPRQSRGGRARRAVDWGRELRLRTKGRGRRPKAEARVGFLGRWALSH